MLQMRCFFCARVSSTFVCLNARVHAPSRRDARGHEDEYKFQSF